MDLGLRTALLVLALTAAVATAQTYPQTASTTQSDEYEPKLVCYYSNWAVYRPGLAKFTPENINPYLCTHLIYAFAALSEDFRLQPFDPYNDVEQGNYRSFVNLKSYNPGLKTLVAVGGWNEGSRRFSRLVESPDARKIFASSAIAFLREHGFDGLDLDWEYPAFREGGNHTTDKKGYALLIKELRQAIEEERLAQSKERLLLTVAVPATKEYIDGGFDVPEISKYADFLNLLTYDYHSAYEPEAQHHAPLFPSPGIEPQDEETQLNVAWTVNYYLSLGAPSRKLVVGLPLYGRSYTLSVPQLAHGYGAPAEAPGEEGSATREKGYLAYYEICQKVKDEEWEVETPSSDQMGPYALKGNQWVGFDDEEMLLNKARYILANNLGGAMIWTLDNDDFRGLCTGEPSPLVGTVRDVLLGSNLIAGSSSQRRSVARSAGLQDRSSTSDLKFDQEAASAPEEEVAEPPRRRNTLRKLVQNRQAARDRQSAGRRINTDSDDNAVAPATTPSPPPTPDPGVGAFECKDEGFFNNPRDCKKYFWCLDSGPANLGVVAHAFTCPSGLHFNSNSESCDYPENVVCPVGSTGSSAAKATPRSRTRSTTTKTTTTTTTTTTTEPPTTTTTEQPRPQKEGGENVAELLRLLQAIGGVERLQSILGAQDQAGKESVAETLPQYVTPYRTTPESNPVEDSAPRTRSRPQHDPYLDPYDYVRPEPTDDEIDLDDLDDDDFSFQYNTPARGSAAVSPGVSYVDDEEEVPPPDGVSYEAPLRPTATPTSSTTSAPEPSKGPYRTPIRVQVGRVVRVQNGTLGNGANAESGQGGRRRMLVRVRPAGSSNRVTEDQGPAPTADTGPQVTGRAVNGDEKRLSGSTLLATRANPSGETRVAVRRRPVYNDRVAEESPGQSVRLVARRPNALGADGNVVAVRRRPSQQVTSPSTTSTTSTTTTTTTTTPAPVTTTTTPLPESAEPSYEYEEEYYDEEEYEDESPATTTTSTTTTTTTTTTKRPGGRLSASNNRRRTTASRPTAAASTTTPRPSSTTPRPSSRRGSSPAQQSSSTAGPWSTNQDDDNDPPVKVLSDNEVICHRRGVFIHPRECFKFVLCAPNSRNAEQQTLKGRVLNCPANQIYLVDIGRCMKGDRNTCQKL